MEFLLVRHGESEGNRDGIMQGSREYSLTDLGRAQADQLARFFLDRRISWSHAFTSPLLRARATCDALVAAGVGPAAGVDPDLREISAGSLEGLNREQIVALHPTFMSRGLEGLGDFSEYGGESYDQMQERVEQLLARHAAPERRRSDDRVLFVSHGGLLFQLAKRLVCLPVPRVMILRLGNCSATLIRMRERRGLFLGEIAWHVPLELTGPVAESDGGALFR